MMRAPNARNALCAYIHVEIHTCAMFRLRAEPKTYSRQGELIAIEKKFRFNRPYTGAIHGVYNIYIKYFCTLGRTLRMIARCS